jgi:mRNA interferase RelE/StbE
MYRLLYQPKAEKQFRSLPVRVQRRVAAGIDALAHWPLHGQDVIALKGEYEGMWRMRVGDYRVIFAVDVARQAVLIVRIASRQQAY